MYFGAVFRIRSTKQVPRDTGIYVLSPYVAGVPSRQSPVTRISDLVTDYQGAVVIVVFVKWLEITEEKPVK